jgi:hypothetical protein
MNKSLAAVFVVCLFCPSAKPSSPSERGSLSSAQKERKAAPTIDPVQDAVERHWKHVVSVLVNSGWKGPREPFQTSGFSQMFVAFEESGKVSEVVLTVVPSQIKALPNEFAPMYNPAYYPWSRNKDWRDAPWTWKLEIVPGLSATARAVGTYEVGGNEIHIDFPDFKFSIDATINDNDDEIKGRWTKEGSTQGGEWNIRRIPLGDNSN